MPESSRSTAMERLLEHGSSLRRLALALARNAAHAEDLVQETWIVALGRKPPSRVDPGRWLRGVLRNILRTERRGERRRQRREEIAARPEAVGDSGAELVERAELLRRIVDLVLGLDPIYREAILLRYFDELSTAAIAERLGIPVDTVRTRLRRGIEKLRSSLDDSHGGDRRAWSLVLLAASTAPLSAAGERAANGSSTPGSAGTRVAVVLGGIGMSVKTIVPIGVLAAALLGLGAVALLAGRRPQPARIELARDVAPAPLPAGDSIAMPRALEPGKDEIAVAALSPRNSAELIVTVRGPAGEGLEGVALEAVRLVAQPGTVRRKGATAARGSSGGDGVFRFHGLEPGDYEVRAVSPGHRPARSEEVELREGAPAEVEIELAAGLDLEGIVLDPSGRPVSGATVSSSRTEDWVGASFVVSSGAPGSDDLAWAAAELMTRTDAGGRFRLLRLPSGNRQLLVRHPDWAPAERGPVAAGSRGLEVRLDRGAAVRGRARDAAGEPVTGALVRAFLRDHHALPGALRTEFEARTDDRGAFSLDKIPRAALRIGVELADGRRETLDVIVPEHGDLEGIEIAVAGASVVRGRVVTDAGEAIEGAAIALVEHAEHGRRIEAVSGAQGTFEISGPRLEVHCSLHVWSPGWPPLETRFRSAPDTDLGDLVIEHGLALGGQVVSAAGARVPGSRVLIGKRAGDSWHSSERFRNADEEGAFHFDGLEPGAYRAWACGEGFVRSEGLDVTLVRGEAPPELRLVLGQGGAVTGRVVSPRGDPEPGARVISETGEFSSWTVTDHLGRFSIAGVRDVEIGLRATRGGRTSRRVRARAGDSVELILGKKAVLAGVVRDHAGGHALGEFQVFVSEGTARSRGKGHVFMDPGGRFVLDDLEPGDRTLRIFAAGYIAHEARISLEPGETETVLAELERGGSISGRLLDGSGRPVPGARVFTVSDEEARRPRAPGTTTAYTNAPDGLVAAETFHAGLPDETRSGADGAFLLDGVRQGRAIIRIEHPDFSKRIVGPVEAPAQGALALGEIRLDGGATVEGTVHGEDGKPVRGGTVHIQPVGEDGPVDTFLYVPISRDGTYSKAGLDPGRAWIEVYGRPETGREVELDERAGLRMDLGLQAPPR